MHARVAIGGEREAVAGGQEGVHVAGKEVDVICFELWIWSTVGGGAETGPFFAWEGGGVMW